MLLISSQERKSLWAGGAVRFRVDSKNTPLNLSDAWICLPNKASACGAGEGASREMTKSNHLRRWYDILWHQSSKGISESVVCTPWLACRSATRNKHASDDFSSKCVFLFVCIFVLNNLVRYVWPPTASLSTCFLPSESMYRAPHSLSKYNHYMSSLIVQHREHPCSELHAIVSFTFPNISIRPSHIKPSKIVYYTPPPKISIVVFLSLHLISSQQQQHR